MELEEIKQDLVYHLIRKRCFENARYKKKWLVIVDGTQLYCGRRKLNGMDAPKDYKTRKRIGDDFVNIIYKMMADGYDDEIIYHYLRKY